LLCENYTLLLIPLSCLLKLLLKPLLCLLIDAFGYCSYWKEIEPTIKKLMVELHHAFE